MPSADFVSFITGDLRNAASPQPSSLVRTPTTHVDVVQTHPSCHPINSPLKKAVQKPREVGLQQLETHPSCHPINSRLKKAVQKPREVGLQQLGTPARKLREMGRNKDAKLICSFAEELERSFKRFLPLDSLGLRPGFGALRVGKLSKLHGRRKAETSFLGDVLFHSDCSNKSIDLRTPSFQRLELRPPGPTGFPNMSWCTGHVLDPESVSISTAQIPNMFRATRHLILDPSYAEEADGA